MTVNLSELSERSPFAHKDLYSFLCVKDLTETST